MRYEVVTKMTLPIEVAVLRLGKFSHRESAYSHLGFNATKLLKEAKLFATTDNRLFILAWDGDKAVGVMAAMVADYFFSDDLVANDYLWYVLPEYRGSKVGWELLTMYERWSSDQGTVDTRVGMTSMINADVFNGIMEKRGYKCIGANYRKRSQA